jgi:hypothetical protein
LGYYHTGLEWLETTKERLTFKKGSGMRQTFYSADSFKVGLLSERKKLLPNALPSIFFGSVQLPTEIPFPVAGANNSEQPPNKKRRVSYVVTHDQGLSFKLILLYGPLQFN